MGCGIRDVYPPPPPRSLGHHPLTERTFPGGVPHDPRKKVPRGSPPMARYQRSFFWLDFTEVRPPPQGGTPPHEKVPRVPPSRGPSCPPVPGPPVSPRPGAPSVPPSRADPGPPMGRTKVLGREKTLVSRNPGFARRTSTAQKISNQGWSKPGSCNFPNNRIRNAPRGALDASIASGEA